MADAIRCNYSPLLHYAIGGVPIVLIRPGLHGMWGLAKIRPRLGGPEGCSEDAFRDVGMQLQPTATMEKLPG